MRNPNKAQTLTDAARAEELALSIHQLDVTDPASVTRAVAETTELTGTIDVLVNNAGVGLRGPMRARKERPFKSSGQRVCPDDAGVCGFRPAGEPLAVTTPGIVMPPGVVPQWCGLRDVCPGQVAAGEPDPVLRTRWVW